MFKPSLGRLGLCLVSLLGLMSLFSASAFASGAPIVTVGEATNKTLNTATLNATVNNNGGGSTIVTFEYGKTKLYGQSVTLSEPVYGESALPVSTRLLGLESLATYHFRITAKNSLGTTVSEDSQFEMLLQWKVEGKPLSAYAKPVGFAIQAESLVTVERSFASGLMKTTCAIGEPFPVTPNDKLVGNWEVPLTKCKTLLNGIEEPKCKPADMTYQLNQFFASPTGAFQYLVSTPSCSLGLKVPLPKGFGIGPLSEQKKLKTPFSETYSTGYTFNWSPELVLTGEQVFKNFGIS
jgi:hypothetical protein